MVFIGIIDQSKDIQQIRKFLYAIVLDLNKLLDESKRLKSMAQAEAAQQAKATTTIAKAAVKPSPRSGLQKQQVQIESDMQVASNEIAQLQLALTCATQPTELADLGRQLKKAEDRLTKLEAQWLELLEQLEQV